MTPQTTSQVEIKPSIINNHHQVMKASELTLYKRQSSIIMQNVIQE